MFKKIKTVVLVSFVFYSVFVGGVVGVTLYADPIDSESLFVSKSVDVEEISGNVVHPDDVVSYGELSEKAQEDFRSSFDSERDAIDTSSDLVGSVVLLDGSYYSVSSFTHGSDITLFVFAGVLILSFLFPGLLLMASGQEDFDIYFILLSAVLICIVMSSVFTIGVSGFAPMYDISYAEVSADPVSVDVDSNSVVAIEDIDPFYRSLLYETMNGGSTVSMDNVEYRSLGTPANDYVFNTYEYVSSDGEIYHLQKSEKGNYWVGVVSLIVFYLLNNVVLGVIYSKYRDIPLKSSNVV